MLIAAARCTAACLFALTSSIVMAPSAFAEDPSAENLPPVADFTATPDFADAPIHASFEAGLSYDPDGTIVSYWFDYGDGTGESGWSTNHDYTVPAVYWVTLIVTDDGGAQGTVSKMVTVNDPGGGGGGGGDGGVSNPPYVSTPGAESGTEGVQVAFGAQGGDPDSDSLTWFWEITPSPLNDPGSTGIVSTADAAVYMTCDDEGQWQMAVTVTDTGGLTASAFTEVNIANAAPQVSIDSPAESAGYSAGSPVSVTATISDSGANDSHTCSIVWGDGTTTAGAVASGQCTATHAYAAAGSPVITVTATDDDGESGSNQVGVVVSAATSSITGNGTFAAKAGKVTFALSASGTGATTSGRLQAWLPRGHRFSSATAGALKFDGPTARWTGAGTYDGRTGYTYSVTATDGARPTGEGRADSISITIRDRKGEAVFTGTGKLKTGSISIVQLT
jgi:hypothetical protein